MAGQSRMYVSDLTPEVADLASMVAKIDGIGATTSLTTQSRDGCLTLNNESSFHCVPGVAPAGTPHRLPPIRVGLSTNEAGYRQHDYILTTVQYVDVNAKNALALAPNSPMAPFYSVPEPPLKIEYYLRIQRIDAPMGMEKTP
jgi:hypothetical protein